MRRHAKITYNAKVRVLGRFVQYIGDRPILSITPELVSEFLGTRATNNGYNVHRKDLSVFFNWVRRVKRIPLENPCGPVERLPHSPAPKRIPTEKEIVKLILAADPTTDEQDLLLVLLHTLGRIDEVLRLRWGDVNFERRQVTLWTRKRKDGALEADVLPINEDLLEVLQKRWRTRKQEEWVFFNEETGTRYNKRPKFMRGLCRRAGLEPLAMTRRKLRGKVRDFDLYYGFHSIRHFMASHLADKEKASLKVISSLLRHKNLRTTEIYLQSIEGSLKEAVKGLEGQFNPGTLGELGDQTESRKGESCKD